jgi:methionyl-tRNA formyltransferase
MIDDRIDTGNILMREEVPVFPFETAGDLHDKLMKHGARIVVRTLEAIAEGNINPRPQTDFMLPGEILKLAPKIFPDDCTINWDNKPDRIHNLIRGLSPYPGARSVFKNKDITITYKIFESRPLDEKHDLNTGQIFSDGKKFIRIACTGGFIEILSLQIEGKTRMSCEEFLRGFRISEFSQTIN